MDVRGEGVTGKGTSEVRHGVPCTHLISATTAQSYINIWNSLDTRQTPPAALAELDWLSIIADFTLSFSFLIFLWNRPGLFGFGAGSGCVCVFECVRQRFGTSQTLTPPPPLSSPSACPAFFFVHFSLFFFLRYPALL